MGLIKQVHYTQACVTLLTNLGCVRNIRKISRALLSQVDLMTFNDETVTPLSRYTGCQSRSALSLRMFWWSCKLSVFKTQMVRLNELATSRLVIRKTELSEYCNSISALTIKPWLGAERLLLVSDLNTNKTTTITSGLRRLGFYMDHRVTGSCWRDSWA